MIIISAVESVYVKEEDIVWNNNFRGVNNFTGLIALANVPKKKYPPRFKMIPDHIDFFNCNNKEELLDIINSVIFGEDKHKYFK